MEKFIVIQRDSDDDLFESLGWSQYDTLEEAMTNERNEYDDPTMKFKQVGENTWLYSDADCSLQIIRVVPR